MEPGGFFLDKLTHRARGGEGVCWCFGIPGQYKIGTILDGVWREP